MQQSGKLVLRNKMDYRNFQTNFFCVFFLIVSLTASVESLAGTRESGHPPILPYWSILPGVWEDNQNTEAFVREGLVGGYQSHDIPVGFVLIDSPWSRTYNDFLIDRERYPNFEQMVSDFRRRGMRTIVWLTGAINRWSHDTPSMKHPDYDKVLANGWYVMPKGHDGYEGHEPFEVKWWKGGGLMLDFTNPAAVEYYFGLMDRIAEAGISGFKVDQTDRPLNGFETLVTGDGREISSEEYREAFYRTIYDYGQVRGHTDFMVMSRGFAHQFDNLGNADYVAPVNGVHMAWGGDFSGVFAYERLGLQFQRDSLYRSAQRGYGGLMVELGGYQNETPTKESLIRYAQMASVFPGWINGGLNGGDTAHLPWFYDDKTVRLYRIAANLKTELAPYVFSLSVHAHKTGEAILRDVDRAVGAHKLGSDLFAQPIDKSQVELDGGVAIALPAGDLWVDFWQMDRIFEGGTQLKLALVGLDYLPLFMRKGAIIPLHVENGVTGLGDPTFAGKTSILVCPGEDKSSFTYYRPLGEGVAFEKILISYLPKDQKLKVHSSSGQDVAYRFILACEASAKDVSGADKWSLKKDKSRLLIDKFGSTFDIQIRK